MSKTIYINEEFCGDALLKRSDREIDGIFECLSRVLDAVGIDLVITQHAPKDNVDPIDEFEFWAHFDEAVQLFDSK